jgi:hypothetical protein
MHDLTPKSPPSAGPSRSRRCALLVGLVLAVHAALLGWSCWIHSPTIDEPAHLASGIAHWRTGSFRPYCVNPHLSRVVGALPVVLTGWRDDPSTAPDAAFSPRLEFRMRDDFVAATGADVFRLMSLARWGMIPFSLLGAIVCFAWARSVYGAGAGWLALLMWCFFPEILGHGALLTPDVPAAATGVLSGFLFDRWLRGPSVGGAVMAGLALGGALLTKNSWLILPVVFAVVWNIHAFRMRRDEAGGRFAGGFAALILLLAVAWTTLNAGYGFHGTFRTLASYEFHSARLSGLDDSQVKQGETGNRFANVWLGRAPVPLPSDYLIGLDLQGKDFESWAIVYANGDVHPGGVWYYYLYAALVKLPLGFLILLWLRACSKWTGPPSATAFLLLLVPLTLLVVSSSMGRLAYFRYLMPGWPFLFVWISGLAAVIPHTRAARLAVGLPLAWMIGGSLCVYPHTVSYFNEAARGPANGRAHLIDSQLDWGQDLLLLKEWYDRHPAARPLKLAYFGPVNPVTAGIDFEFLPTSRERSADGGALRPGGWYAISAHFVQGGPGQAFVDGRRRESVGGADLARFRNLEPVDRVGYSILIYHLPSDRVSHKPGLF